MVKVSIIVPIYNLESCLTRLLKSIAGQTHTDMEVLLIDDGSSDGSLQLCKDLAGVDARFKVLHHENRGVSYTRNRGIEAACGQYIMFVDGDDEVLPDMVEKYVEQAEKTSADIVIGGLTFVENEAYTDIQPPCGLFTKRDFLDLVCRDTTGLYGYVPNKLYRREVLTGTKAVRFNEGMAAQEDLDFALSAYAHGGSFCLFPYCGYLYYHVSGKRDVPVLDLIRNQQKLLDLAVWSGVNEESKDLVKAKIQNLVYGALFHAKRKEDILKIAETPGLFEHISSYKGQSKEMKCILALFIKKHFGLILVYFRIRACIKKLLKRESY